MRRVLFVVPLMLVLVLTSCAQTKTVEVTRLVTVPVTQQVRVEVTRVVTREVTRVITVPVEVTRIVTRVVTATPTPEPTPTPTPENAPLGSRSNPFPFGEWATFQDSSGRVLKMRFSKLVRGKQAEEIVNRGADFLTVHPETGDEFVLVYVEVEYVKGPADRTWSIDMNNFQVVANNELHGPPITLGGFEEEKQLEATLFPGGKAEGWVLFSVPVGSDVTTFGYTENMFFAAKVWFAAP